jgi:hypothetical protein
MARSSPSLRLDFPARAHFHPHGRGWPANKAAFHSLFRSTKILEPAIPVQGPTTHAPTRIRVAHHTLSSSPTAPRGFPRAPRFFLLPANAPRARGAGPYHPCDASRGSAGASATTRGGGARAPRAPAPPVIRAAAASGSQPAGSGRSLSLVPRHALTRTGRKGPHPTRRPHFSPASFPLCRPCCR